MSRILVVLSVAGLLFSGCRKAPEPEAVAETFYELCEVARQEGFDRVQADLYGLMTTASQESLAACAKQVETALGEGIALSPEQCFIFDRFLGTRNDFETKRTADGKERVRLEVTSGSVKHFLELVQEDGWKIDLKATAALNAEPEPAQ